MKLRLEITPEQRVLLSLAICTRLDYLSALRNIMSGIGPEPPLLCADIESLYALKALLDAAEVK